MIRALFIFVLAMIVGGCSMLGPVNTPQIHTYTLKVNCYSNQVRHKNKITLMLSTPTASAGYQTNSMIYNKKPFELSSFTKNQWAGPPAAMLQPLILQYLRNTNYFHAIIASPISATRNYRLAVNLIELRHDFTYNPSRVEMAIQAELIDDASSKVINSRVFTSCIPVKADTPYAGVWAANRATDQILRALAQFCVNSLVPQSKVAYERVILPEPDYHKHSSHITVFHKYITQNIFASPLAGEADPGLDPGEGEG